MLGPHDTAFCLYIYLHRPSEKTFRQRLILVEIIIILLLSIYSTLKKYLFLFENMFF